MMSVCPCNEHLKNLHFVVGSGDCMLMLDPFKCYQSDTICIAA